MSYLVEEKGKMRKKKRKERSLREIDEGKLREDRYGKGRLKRRGRGLGGKEI